MTEETLPIPTKPREFELSEGELHAMIYMCVDFIMDFKSKALHWRALGIYLKEMAVKKDRKSILCLETYNRIDSDQHVDQLYVFGLSWYIIEYMAINEKYEIVRKVAKRLRVLNKRKPKG